MNSKFKLSALYIKFFAAGHVDTEVRACTRVGICVSSAAADAYAHANINIMPLTGCEGNLCSQRSVMLIIKRENGARGQLYMYNLNWQNERASQPFI